MLSLLGSLRRGNFVTNSLRFRSSASANLTRTPSVDGARNIWTFSCWIKRGAMGTVQIILDARDFANSTNSFPYGRIAFLADDTLQYQESYNGNEVGLRVTSQVFRDPSAWYHIVVALNTTLPTVSDRVKLYVNGSQITNFSLSKDLSGYSSIITSNKRHCLAGNITATSGVIGNTVDGYLTEVYLIDGQALTPSSFGQIESTTGVWSPKQYVGTYGTNGFYLKFSDANAATAAAIGKDSSGNGNNWTPSGISVTPGVTYDSMLDVPVNYSDNGNGRGNYAVLNPLDQVTTATLAAANLQTTSTAAQNIIGSMSMDSGSWYWEIAYSAATASQLIGVYKTAATTASITPTINAIGLKFNADTGALDYTVDGSTYTSIATGLTGGGYFPYAGSLTNAKIIYANFGQRPFAYTPPAGFRALNTNNLPTPSIVNGANFMAATAYTGNATARSLSNVVNGVSFQPDLVWIKSRTPGATSHALFDSVRGTTKYLSSNTTTGETTLSQSLTAFGADGFSLGTDTTLVNANANSYIAWQWKESVAAGLDIVNYTGTGVARTVAHNLGVAPAMIIVKNMSTGVDNWSIYHAATGATNVLIFTTAAAASSSITWNNTAPTSSNFAVGTNSATNGSGNSLVAYCFAEIAGFSRFGSYTGNGSADGPFVFCGFRPKWVMVKRTDVAGDWRVWDSARDTYNAAPNVLFSNLSNVEASSAASPIDVLSNGFKLRGTGGDPNTTGGTYIFAAFAEVPSKYALAR